MLTQYLLLWLLFFLPLLFPKIFTDIYDLPKMLFFYFCSFLLIISTSLHIFFKKSLILPKKNFLRLLFLFISVYTLSTIFSIHKLTSLIGLWDIKYSTYTGGLVHLATLMLLFFAILQTKPKNKFLSQITLYLTSSATLISLYGIYQYIEQFMKDSPGYRIRSTIGEPNKLAFFLIAILPLSTSLFLNQKRKVYKTLSFICCLIILLATTLTFSRAAWITLFIITSTSLVSNIKKLKHFAKKNKIYLSLLLCLVFLSFFLSGKLLAKRIAAIAYDLKMQTGSTYIRLLEWQTGLKLFKNQSLKNKVIGTGPETLKFTYARVRPIKINQFPSEKHFRISILRNQYLHYLNTIGIIGLFLFLLFIAFIFKTHLKVKRKSIYQNGFFYAWFTIVINNLFYYQTIVTHCLFWVSAAIILNSDGLRKIKLKKQLFLKIILSLTTIFAASSLISLFFISQSLIYARYKNFPKAIKITPFFDFLWREYSFRLQNKALLENSQETAKEAIFAAEKAVTINPLEPTNLLCLHAALYKGSGYLQMDKKYQERALDIAQKCTVIDPSNPNTLDALGLSYLDLGQHQNALQNFQKAISMDNEMLISYLHAGEALKQMGQINEAIIYYQKALEKKPDWSFAQKELEKTKTLLSK